jgi:uncharacterized coiled-coil DUF342 family protein
LVDEREGLRAANQKVSEERDALGRRVQELVDELDAVRADNELQKYIQT